MLNKNIVTFIGCDAEYDEARDRVCLERLLTLPHRFVREPGLRVRPSASDSYGLETYSPYQDRDLTDCHIFDSGDLELAIGDSEKVLAAIEERAETILKDDKLPFLIGGEHLVTLGSVRAAARKYPDLHIIHLDAHTDLREDYLGVQLSHACVIRTLLGDFGGRTGFISLEFVPETGKSFDWAKAGHTKPAPFDLEGLEETVRICLKENRFILRWIWMCWIRRYFREQERRSRAE